MRGGRISRRRSAASLRSVRSLRLLDWAVARDEGLNAAAIAQALGVSERTVFRYLG